MSSNLNDGLNKLRLQNTGCDVIFEIGSQSFPAHRVVLMARLEYFENMFTGDMRDKKESNISLDPRVIDPAYFSQILDYIYTSKIYFTRGNIRSIYKIADYFCFDELTNKIKEHMKSSMTLDNVSLYRNIAIEFQFESWKSASTKFNFKHIFIDIFRCSKRKQIPALPFDDFETNLQKMKEAGRLEDMFHYSVDWVLHDHVNRSIMMPELLKNIPLNDLSFYFLTKIVPQYNIIKEDNECRDLLLDAIIYYSYQATNNTLYVIGGMCTNDQMLSSVSEYNSVTREWTAATPMPSQRSHFGCAVIGHKIYVCGGNYEHRNTNELTVFNTHTRRWIQQKPMKHTRQTCGVAVLNGKIYVAGGFDGTNRLTVVERYCLTTDGWEDVAPMTMERSSFELVALNGFLYAIGGYDGFGKLCTVERYDPQADQWIKMNNMNNGYSSFGSAVLNGRIYIVGQFSCEEYSPADDKWTEMSAPSKCGDGRRLAVYDSKLYALGGRVGEQVNWKGQKAVEVFDFQERVWRPEPDMNVARCFHGVAVVEE